MRGRGRGAFRKYTWVKPRKWNVIAQSLGGTRRRNVESGSRHPRMGRPVLPPPCLEALPPAGRVDNPKALVASRQAVAERGLEDLSNQAASGGVRVG